MPENRTTFWKTLLVSPIALSAAMMLSPNAAQAQSMQVAQAAGPVTAISELSDVQPTDWAFQALQSLVERYGCIAGYPDRTYRGNRAMTRFEFAAGMNACLDRINELIASGLADKVSKEDLATVQKLQEEFQAELAALKGRVDKIEADVKTLQGQVFNPVTKLQVEVVTALVGQGLSEDIKAAVPNFGAVQRRDEANMTLNYRVRMNFNASFVGNDRLRIRLQGRNAQPAFFFGDPTFGFSGGASTNGSPNVQLSKLDYRFRMFNNSVTAYIGFVGTGASDVLRYGLPTDALSDFADAPDSTHDSTNGGDATFGFNWKASDLVTLSYAYTSSDPGSSSVGGAGFGNSGIFGGSSKHAVELGFTPSDNLEIYLAYANSYDQGGVSLSGYIPTTGTNESTDAYTIAVNWELSPRVLFTGWFSGGSVNVKNGTPLSGKDFNGFLVGFAFPDLFMEGANGGITWGQPFASTDSAIIPSRPSVLDVYYSFPVNDYLTLTPGFYYVSNPLAGANSGIGASIYGVPVSNDPSIFVGALRATFSF
jgi:hypothetical protein